MRKPASLHVLVALAAASVASGCSSSSAPRVEVELLGTWRWVEATGGIAGVTNTPESTGLAMTLHFGPAGLARLERTDLEDRVVGFEVVEQGSSGTEYEIRYAEPLMGFETQTARLPTTRELVLTDPCCDGFVWRFERAP